MAVALLVSLVLCRELGFKQGGLALVLAFFGSSFIRYASYDLTYTHAAEAGLLALAIYAFWKKRPAWQLGALLGLLTLVRFTSALFFIPFLLYFAFKKEWNHAIQVCVGALPFAVLLMAYFSVQFGGPLTTGYTANPGYDVKNFSLLPVYVGKVLFSLEGNPPGLLWWTPLVLLSFAGLYWLKDERKWVLLGIVALMFWHAGSLFEGTTGFSYGNRYFAALFPLITLGMASVLEKGKNWKWISIALGAYGAMMFLLVFCRDWGHFASYGEVLAYWFLQGHLTELPGAVFDKLGLVRLLLRK